MNFIRINCSTEMSTIRSLIEVSRRADKIIFMYHLSLLLNFMILAMLARNLYTPNDIKHVNESIPILFDAISFLHTKIDDLENSQNVKGEQKCTVANEIPTELLEMTSIPIIINTLQPLTHQYITISSLKNLNYVNSICILNRKHGDTKYAQIDVLSISRGGYHYDIFRYSAPRIDRCEAHLCETNDDIINKRIIKYLNISTLRFDGYKNYPELRCSITPVLQMFPNVSKLIFEDSEIDVYDIKKFARPQAMIISKSIFTHGVKLLAEIPTLKKIVSDKYQDNKVFKQMGMKPSDD